MSGGHLDNVSEWLGRARRILRDLMVNLIYPAVLGSVLYLLFTVFEHITWTILHSSSPRQLDSDLAWKTTLLCLIIIFYACDYVYLLLTRTFRVSFFVYDLFFLTTLYVGVWALHLGPSDNAAVNPVILTVCFLSFMPLYLFWDLLERSDLQKEKARIALPLGLRANRAISDTPEVESVEPLASAEKPCREVAERLESEIALYDEVILWEIFSFISFGALLGWELCSGPSLPLLPLTVILALSAVWFARLIWRKAAFYQPYEST